MPSIKSKTERIKHAKKIVLEINTRLIEGWSPFLETTGKNHKTFTDAVAGFLKQIQKQLNDGLCDRGLHHFILLLNFILLIVIFCKY